MRSIVVLPPGVREPFEVAPEAGIVETLDAAAVQVRGDDLCQQVQTLVVERRAWLAHLERRYTAKQAAAHLRAWAKDDHYARLSDEAAGLARTGFAVDIAWRRGCFAVIVGTK